MKLLFVIDSVYNQNSGAAGSVISIGENIKALGHDVNYIWRKENRLIKSNNYYRFFELPIVQYTQIKTALKSDFYEAIIVSQPHAWLAFLLLRIKYHNTLFINRTHGWEIRIAQAGKSIESKDKSFKKKISLFITNFLIYLSSYLTVKYSDAVLCASSSDSQFIKANYRKYSDKIFSISYGLDQSYLNLQLSNKVNKKEDCVHFLFTGQYMSRKGIYDLMYVFKEISEETTNFKLTFVVNENAIANVKSDFSYLNNEQLNVYSWMNRENLINLYLQHHVFLMPSYGEGFGKTTIEAMACGLCIIGYQEGALMDFGKHNQNSLLTAVGNIRELKENIVYAINNIQKTIPLGLKAYKDVQEQTWQKCANNTLDLINDLRNKKIK